MDLIYPSKPHKYINQNNPWYCGFYGSWLLWVCGLLAFLLIILVLATGASAAVAVPEAPASLYVLDQAGVMSQDAESSIISTSQDLARATKAQVAVVTLQSLDDQPLEEVSLAILRKWGLGDKKLNNGVLILLVLNDRKSRIEVGYGLEGALPDGKTGRIQDEYMVPYFKQGDYERGLLTGYRAIVNEVGKEYNVTINLQDNQGINTDSTSGHSQPWTLWQKILLVIGLIILFYLDRRYFNGFIFGFILGSLLRMGSGRGGGGGGSFGGGGSGGGGGSSRGW